MIPRNIHLIILRYYVVRNLRWFPPHHVRPRHFSLTGLTLLLSTYEYHRETIDVWLVSPAAVRSLVCTSNNGPWALQHGAWAGMFKQGDRLFCLE